MLTHPTSVRPKLPLHQGIPFIMAKSLHKSSIVQPLKRPNPVRSKSDLQTKQAIYVHLDPRAKVFFETTKKTCLPSWIFQRVADCLM